MEEQLKAFLSRYLGQGTQKKDIVTQEAIDLLAMAAKIDHFEQDIIDYGTAHPDAPFWDFMQFGHDGLLPDDDGEDLLHDEED
jgi:hypothetical protein